jgi:hypothetical protein
MHQAAHNLGHLAFILAMLGLSTGLMIRPRWFAFMTPLVRQTDAEMRVGGILLFPIFAIALILWVQG